MISKKEKSECESRGPVSLFGFRPGSLLRNPKINRETKRVITV